MHWPAVRAAALGILTLSAVSVEPFQSPQQLPEQSRMPREILLPSKPNLLSDVSQRLLGYHPCFSTALGTLGWLVKWLIPPRGFSLKPTNFSSVLYNVVINILHGIHGQPSQHDATALVIHAAATATSNIPHSSSCQDIYQQQRSSR
eukprot:TRINITY_DN68043_c0_g2_i14.p1 TRINITY_DN68043_c0_g2~~TRINITY_DN68043_c0_g2_i14.p1  ORF type:complete len:147 (+),score=18.01 TRINITY_DN68043_c0_g2_i14:684-1124(+)